MRESVFLIEFDLYFVWGSCHFVCWSFFIKTYGTNLNPQFIIRHLLYFYFYNLSLLCQDTIDGYKPKKRKKEKNPTKVSLLNHDCVVRGVSGLNLWTESFIPVKEESSNVKTIDSHIPVPCTHHDTEPSPIYKSALRKTIPPEITFQPQASALTKGARPGQKKKPSRRFQKHLCWSMGMLNLLLKTAMSSRPTIFHYQAHLSDITLCPLLSGKVERKKKPSLNVCETIRLYVTTDNKTQASAWKLNKDVIIPIVAHLNSSQLSWKKARFFKLNFKFFKVFLLWVN